MKSESSFTMIFNEGNLFEVAVMVRIAKTLCLLEAFMSTDRGGGAIQIISTFHNVVRPTVQEMN